MPRITWGRGERYGTFSPTLDRKGTEYKPIQVWTGDYLYIQFGDMQLKLPFYELKRLEVLRCLNEIPGIKISDSDITIALCTVIAPPAPMVHAPHQEDLIHQR